MYGRIISTIDHRQQKETIRDIRPFSFHQAFAHEYPQVSSNYTPF